MKHEHLLLWQKLESFDLDGDASLSFSKRLARDNGWSHDFARRVVGEYKKFLFLAATCGHPVTPSDEVDQAWHLHLVYTRSYWDELCGEILGFPFHHGPTKGGAKEGAKFGNWYEKTLASYRAAFGEEAPLDVWPEASVRFGHATSFRRVNLKRVWVVRKPTCGVISRERSAQLAPVLLFLFLAGCAEAQSVGPNVFNWHGEAFLQFFWALSAGVFALAWWLRSRSLEPRDAVFPTQPLDAYEVARLRDGKSLAADVALATLWEKGALEVTGNAMLRAVPTPTPVLLHPFERAIWERLGDSTSSTESSVQSARRELEAHTRAMDERLRSLGLLVSRDVQKRGDSWLKGGAVALLLVGAIKIVVGLSRERPVGFLVISCALLLGILLFVAFNPARRSRRGDAFLQHLLAQQKVTAPKSFRLCKAPEYEARNKSAGDYEALTLTFALVGSSAFPLEMQRVLYPSSSGDGGSGGGDGGGGGGGGCGGCGGGH